MGAPVLGITPVSELRVPRDDPLPGSPSGSMHWVAAGDPVRRSRFGLRDQATLVGPSGKWVRAEGAGEPVKDRRERWLGGPAVDRAKELPVLLGSGVVGHLEPAQQ